MSNPFQVKLEESSAAALAIEAAAERFPIEQRMVALIVNLLDADGPDGFPLAPEVLAAAVVDTGRYLAAVGKRPPGPDTNTAIKARALLKSLSES